MKELLGDLRMIRKVGLIMLALVLVVALANVVVAKVRAADAAGAVLTDPADFSLDSDVAITSPQYLDLCSDGDDAAGDDTEARCASQITRKPGAPQPGTDHLATYAANGSNLAGFTPAEIRDAYNIPDAGSDATIGIVVAYGYDGIETDLAAYRTAYDLGDCTVANGCLTIVNQRGKKAPLPTEYHEGWAIETAMDVDMASAACPTCSIVVAVADSPKFSDMFAAVGAAQAAGAGYLSLSWGAAGVDNPGDFDRLLRDDVLYFAATGDNGYGDVQYPAASNRVIGVGGTSLHRDPGSDRGWVEQAWGGASSGCYPAVEAPAWQRGILPEGACDGNAVSDLSAVASGTTPVSTRFNGGWYSAFGTSAATPIVAGIYASAGVTMSTPQALAQIYRNAGFFHDVTAGLNGSCGGALCTAGTGWDGPTGVGSPDARAMFSLAPPPVDMTSYPTTPPTGVDHLAAAAAGESVPCPAEGGQDPPWVCFTDGSTPPANVTISLEDDGTAVISGTLGKGESLPLQVDESVEKIEFNIVLEFVDDDGNVVQSDEFTISADNLPEGLRIVDGVLTGTIDGWGSYEFDIGAALLGGEAESLWTVSIEPATEDDTPPAPDPTQDPADDGDEPVEVSERLVPVSLQIAETSEGILPIGEPVDYNIAWNGDCEGEGSCEGPDWFVRSSDKQQVTASLANPEGDDFTGVALEIALEVSDGTETYSLFRDEQQTVTMTDLERELITVTPAASIEKVIGYGDGDDRKDYRFTISTAVSKADTGNAFVFSWTIDSEEVVPEEPDTTGGDGGSRPGSGNNDSGGTPPASDPQLSPFWLPVRLNIDPEQLPAESGATALTYTIKWNGNIREDFVEPYDFFDVTGETLKVNTSKAVSFNKIKRGMSHPQFDTIDLRVGIYTDADPGSSPVLEQNMTVGAFSATSPSVNPNPADSMATIAGTTYDISIRTITAGAGGESDQKIIDFRWVINASIPAPDTGGGGGPPPGGSTPNPNNPGGTDDQGPADTNPAPLDPLPVPLALSVAQDDFHPDIQATDMDYEVSWNGTGAQPSWLDLTPADPATEATITMSGLPTVGEGEQTQQYDALALRLTLQTTPDGPSNTPEPVVVSLTNPTTIAPTGGTITVGDVDYVYTLATTATPGTDDEGADTLTLTWRIAAEKVTADDSGPAPGGDPSEQPGPGNNDDPPPTPSTKQITITVQIALTDLFCGAGQDPIPAVCPPTDPEGGNSGGFLPQGRYYGRPTVVDDVLAPGASPSAMQLVEAISGLPTVTGLTPAFTANRVIGIRLAQLMAAMWPHT